MNPDPNVGNMSEKERVDKEQLSSQPEAPSALIVPPPPENPLEQPPVKASPIIPELVQPPIHPTETQPETPKPLLTPEQREKIVASIMNDPITDSRKAAAASEKLATLQEE